MGMKISDLTNAATIVPASTYIEIEQTNLTAGVRSRKSLLSTFFGSIGTFLFGSTTPALTANTTVNLLTTDTTAAKQAKIDAVPKNLNGYTLTIQSADGVHTPGAVIDITGFYNGTINYYGNATDASLALTKSVSYAPSGDFATRFTGCICKLNIYYIRWRGDNITANTQPMLQLSGCPDFDIRYCSFNALSADKQGLGTYIINNSIGVIRDCWFQNCYNNTYAAISCFVSRSDNDEGSGGVPAGTALVSDRSIILNKEALTGVAPLTFGKANGGQVGDSTGWL